MVVDGLPKTFPTFENIQQGQPYKVATSFLSFFEVMPSSKVNK